MRVEAAIGLIAAVPGYADTASALHNAAIEYRPTLADRGQATLMGRILLGPETFQSAGPEAILSLAGTLVHEQHHRRQPLLAKTASFWQGVLTRTHPMRRYEWPAYQAQAAFLQALADARPDLRPAALREREAALAAFHAYYRA